MVEPAAGAWMVAGAHTAQGRRRQGQTMGHARLTCLSIVDRLCLEDYSNNLVQWMFLVTEEHADHPDVPKQERSS